METTGKILLDVLGGDHAPKAILDGALLALPDLRRTLVLIGDEKVIRKHAVSRGRTTAGPVEIVHAPENIEMMEGIKALRSKKDASINVGNRMSAESWDAYKKGTGTPSAFVSAGHSGAMMASALLSMGRLGAVERPAIATRLPTTNGKGVVILDAGANVDCKPEHLQDFAVMGALYAGSVGAMQGLARPKIAILSNGEEKSKGNELTRGTYALLEGSPTFTGSEAIGEFTGYIEGKQMFKGHTDVVVTDGFVGNLILKNSEGLANAIISILKAEARSSLFGTLGFAIAYGVLKRVKKKLDYRETGSAPLLGVAGYTFISHGSSDKVAIRNALLRAHEALDSRMIERLETALDQLHARKHAAPVTPA